MKNDEKARSEAVRLIIEHIENYASEQEAVNKISERLGIEAEVLHDWVHQIETNSSSRDAIISSMACEIRDLRRKTQELEETIRVVQSATTFFVTDNDPRH